MRTRSMTRYIDDRLNAIAEIVSPNQYELIRRIFESINNNVINLTESFNDVADESSGEGISDIQENILDDTPFRRFYFTLSPIGHDEEMEFRMFSPPSNYVFEDVKVVLSKQEFNRLKHLKIKKKEQVNSCSICLENMEHKQIVTKLACGHNFHKECSKHWLCDTAVTCPMCRTDVRTIIDNDIPEPVVIEVGDKPLDKLTVLQLKALCKQKKIKNYSSLKKNEIIELINMKDQNIVNKNLIEKPLEKYTVPELKSLCREKKIKKYTRKLKKDLIEMIRNNS